MMNLLDLHDLKGSTSDVGQVWNMSSQIGDFFED